MNLKEKAFNATGRACVLRGSIHTSKRRVIWSEGVLHVFKMDGDRILCEHQIECELPRIKTGFWQTYQIRNNLRVQGSCWHCGGWMKVAYKKAGDLLALDVGDSVKI